MRFFSALREIPVDPAKERSCHGCGAALGPNANAGHGTMMDRPESPVSPGMAVLLVVLTLVGLAGSAGGAGDEAGPLLMPSGQTQASSDANPPVENPAYDLFGCPVYPPDCVSPKRDATVTSVPGSIVEVVERLPEVKKAPVASATPPSRSMQLEQIAREADMHTRRGFGLAGRKAYYSAKYEFVTALRLVAQGLDAEQHTKKHTEALGRGLAALKEAEDFLPRGSRLEADLDIPGIVARHRTEVLRAAALDTMTAMEALERYFSYAQAQLAAAAEPECAGSMALYGLGKLHTVLAEKSLASDSRASEPKAMTYYQAAILAHPTNSMAANDLGVLLGRAGRFEDARRLLEYSVGIAPQATTWKNLGKVYAQLGRADLASQADDRAQALEQAQAVRTVQDGGAADGRVRWVDRSAFEPTATMQ